MMSGFPSGAKAIWTWSTGRTPRTTAGRSSTCARSCPRRGSPAARGAARPCARRVGSTAIPVAADRRPGDGRRGARRHLHRRLPGPRTTAGSSAEQYLDRHAARHAAPADVRQQVDRRAAVCAVLADRGRSTSRRPLDDLHPRVRRERLPRRDRAQPARHAFGHRASPRSTSTRPPRCGSSSRSSAGRRGPRPICPHSLYECLATLAAERAHGGPFEYRSCETDVLGWVCERASGVRMPDLLAEPDLGDRCGRARHGRRRSTRPAPSATTAGSRGCLRDLGRFGQMLADDGVVRATAWSTTAGHPRVVDPRHARAAPPTRGRHSASSKTTPGCPAACTATSSGCRTQATRS